MLRCLAYFLVPKSRKKKVIEDSSDIPHVVMEGNVSKKLRDHGGMQQRVATLYSVIMVRSFVKCYKLKILHL